MFWLVFSIYFYIIHFNPKQYQDLFVAKPYYLALMTLSVLAPVFILTVYFFHYYIAGMVKDRKYFKATLYAIAAFVVGTGINYWAAYFDPSEVQKAMTVTNKVNSRFEYSSFYTRWALILGIKVTGFELAKSWYLKSQENLEMFRIKAKSETRARKSRINPAWLFQALDKIKNNLDRQSATSTAMILNLSDLLSYSLYESDADLVELEKEFSELQHLFTIEQLDVFALVRINVQKSGDFLNKSVAPMSVINRVVEHINAAPIQRDSLSQINLHFHAGKNLLELISLTVCASGRTTTTMNWVLSDTVSNERIISAY